MATMPPSDTSIHTLYITTSRQKGTEHVIYDLLTFSFLHLPPDTKIAQSKNNKNGRPCLQRETKSQGLKKNIPQKRKSLRDPSYPLESFSFSYFIHSTHNPYFRCRFHLTFSSSSARMFLCFAFVVPHVVFLLLTCLSLFSLSYCISFCVHASWARNSRDVYRKKKLAVTMLSLTADVRGGFAGK